jgi:UDP-N-acetylglucosamine transferase subunit ALG13
MILLTVGTLAPFDRLVKAVDELVGAGAIREAVFAQIGRSTYRPVHFEAVPSLPKHDFEARVRESSTMIGHAGMGSIMLALEHGRPLLVMPRLHVHGEHVNDHQVGTARKFAESGHVLAAMAVEELPARLAELASFRPGRRSPQVAMVSARIARYLAAMSPRPRAR